MAKVLQFPLNKAKVVYSEGIYLVMVWSQMCGNYICQGEWLTRTEAEIDCRMWNN